MYLANPHMMLGKRFLCIPPPGNEDLELCTGQWKMESYTVQMREGLPDREFLVSSEAMDWGIFPMCWDDFEELLTHSTLVA